MACSVAHDPVPPGQETNVCRVRVRRLAIVCFEDPRQVSGGVQRRVAAEVSYFARRGVEVVVLTEGSGKPATQGKVQYIPVATPPVVYPLRTVIFSVRASQALRRLPAFDVVETHHDAGATLLLAQASPARHSAFVEVVHGVFRDELATVRRYERLFSRSTLAASGLLPLSLIEQSAARRAKAVVTVSQYCAGQVARRYGVPDGNIHIVPNGIDTARYAPRGRDARAAASTTCEILYVGRWHARKGVLPLLRAFARAHREDPRLRLKLVGGGPLNAVLREESQQLGVGGAVSFLGGLDDATLTAAYQAADIVAIPSLQEGQGIVALEAQACGAPVVATRAGGLAEVVCDGQTGIVVPPGVVEPLTAALLALAGNPALRREYGRNAAVWAHTFAWEKMLARSAALYEELVSRPTSRRAEVRS